MAYYRDEIQKYNNNGKLNVSAIQKEFDKLSTSNEKE